MSQATAEQIVAWVRSLYEQANKSQDRGILPGILSDNAEINFNNVHGKAELEKLIRWQYDAAERITYEVEDIAVLNNKVFVQTKQNYALKGGKQHTLKVCTVFHKIPGQNKVSAIDIYAETHEVFKDVESHLGRGFNY